jgi:colicin import membrane protein
VLTSFSPGISGALVGAATRRLLELVALALLVGGAQAEPNQSMEERLRAQLRITTTQLQQAQNELATLKSGAGAPKIAAPQSDLDALKKDLARAQSQLSAERHAAGGRQAQNEAALEKTGAQLVQQRTAYEAAFKLARAAEAERLRLNGENEAQRTTLTQCEAKNGQLYAVSQKILLAYETMDLGTLMAARQPFAAQSRVKLEQAAQQYGDQLYAGRFDARSVAAPVQAAALEAKAAPEVVVDAKAVDGTASAGTP